jgi:hypothetical protein
MEIPESYVLGRWRLDAKHCASKENKVNMEESDPKLIKAARCRNICPKMVKLGTRSSELKAAYEYLDSAIDSLCVDVDKIFFEAGDSIEEGTKEVDTINPNFLQAKGLKKKKINVHKGRVRLKPWHENIRKRKRLCSKPTRLAQVLV